MTLPRMKILSFLSMAGIVALSWMYGSVSRSYDYRCITCHARMSEHDYAVWMIPIWHSSTPWVAERGSRYDAYINREHTHIYWGGGYGVRDFSGIGDGWHGRNNISLLEMT